MKRKIGKRVAALLLSTSFFVSTFVACNEQTGDVEVWSTYNILKVMRDLHNYPKLSPKLSVDLAIGETEAAQLLFTSEKDVKNFKLVAGELKSGDNVFTPENVSVYVQKYVNVVMKTHLQKNENYPTGYTPDMLLPMSLAEKYGENNSEAGANQGFYIEFTADSNTIPGMYTGVFTLQTDSMSTEIPVSVTVRNVTIAHSYGKSSFGLYQSTLENGEMDSSDAMYTKYYETLMRDYKVMLMHVPYALELDKFADSVLKYYDEPQFTSYGIPTFGGGDAQFDEAAFYDYVYEIAVCCTPEKNYLEKAYMYPLMADEPQDARKREIMMMCTAARDNLQYEIIDRLNANGFFDDYGGVDGEFAKTLQKSLQKLPCVITTDAIEGFGEEVDTYCPPMQYFSTDYLRGLYKEHESRNSGETWYYTCMQPIYPYPSHHIDDYLIGSRSMKWMQMAYDLEGYLYWHTSYYLEGKDNYAEASHFYFNGAPYNGDGYLTYPGAKYDYDGFLPSLRLTSYRDGQEDYDLLRSYDEALSTIYGGEVTANDVFTSSYEALFGGTIYNPSAVDFAAERKLLLDRAEALNSATGLVAYVQEENNASKLIVLAKEGSEIFVNGEKVTAQNTQYGVKYTATISGTVTVKATNGDSVAEYSLKSKKAKTSATLDVSAMQMSESSLVYLSEAGLDMTIVGKGDTIIQINSFKPGFFIQPTTVGGNLKELDSLTLKIDNQSNQAYPIEIVFTMSDGTSITLEKYTLQPGENTIDIRNIPLYYGFTGKKPERLRVIFPNSENNVIIKERKVTLQELSYTKLGG